MTTLDGSRGRYTPRHASPTRGAAQRDAGLSAEHARLAQCPGADDPWRLWGPYVSARQWGTVREDYSADGDAWGFFPFDHAHTRAYRWGEDGIAGLTDRFGFLTIAPALWNGRDDRLKERLFGLTNAEGNHGEDLKEYSWALDATPTHSWARYLYRYPQAAYPYDELRRVNGERGYDDDEYELSDTGVLEQDRFFDVVITHAKASETDILLRFEATNHGPDAAPLHLLPQVWFRNTWRWGRDERVPRLEALPQGQGPVGLRATHDWLGVYEVHASGSPTLLFCDNETNEDATFGTGSPGASAHPVDAVGRYVVHGERGAVSPESHGTKAAFHYVWDAVEPGQTVSCSLRLRGVRPAQGDSMRGYAPMPGATRRPDEDLRDRQEGGEEAADGAAAASAGGSPGAGEDLLGEGFEAVLAQRRQEADLFYDEIVPADAGEDDRLIARRAFAGLLWCKQLYRYSIDQWLEGDPGEPAPAPGRGGPGGRNAAWRHLDLADVISMPDEWEYPWFATWDLAFHTVALAHVDPEFAKHQLVLLCREWSQHPNGQLPAYEWDFGDVNPPVHAWATWQVYALDGGGDREFLIQVFTKLMMNFQWWVNRKDADGSYLFEGGFLGMDNIGFIDRSRWAQGRDVRLEQSDATSWMAFFSLSMLRIALELSKDDPAWDGTATTFIEYFLRVARAMDDFGSEKVSLWDDEDGFYYDVLVSPQGSAEHMPVRSLVGLLPLMAVAVAPEWVKDALPDFTSELEWLASRRPGLTQAIVTTPVGEGERTTLALVPAERVERLLARMLDEEEFLSPHGIRSLSAAHRGGLTATVGGQEQTLWYWPAESRNGMFGGNSNWRGPVWFPTNLLLVDALRTYDEGLGGALQVEYPTGSGRRATLTEVADDLRERLIGLFRAGEDGRRPGTPVHHPGGELWDAHPTFSEYFDGDTGAGLGASHQTGWTGLVAHLVCGRNDASVAGSRPRRGR